MTAVRLRDAAAWTAPLCGDTKTRPMGLLSGHRKLNSFIY